MCYVLSGHAVKPMGHAQWVNGHFLRGSVGHWIIGHCLRAMACSVRYLIYVLYFTYRSRSKFCL